MQQPARTPYWLALALGLLGPLFYLITFATRFGRLEMLQITESLYTYLPVALGSLALVWLLNKAASQKARRFVWLGYLVALPLGLFGAAAGGMLGILGIVLFGALPLAVGAALGFGLGRLFK